MAEYLSPGVYVEEFDSGIKAMEGLGTSTAGFIGMAQNGMTTGRPKLITSFADYLRYFGGYLQEDIYGETRYMPYAVEQFFLNGGSFCYVMRVKAPNLTAANSVVNDFITFTALNEGSIGNTITVTMSARALKNSKLAEGSTPAQARYELENADIFNVGDMVYVKDGAQGETSKCSFALINEKAGNIITLSDDLGAEINNIYLYEPQVTITDDMLVEQYEKLSFNPDSVNYIKSRLDKSNLVTVKIDFSKFTASILDGFIKSDNGNEILLFTFSGGSDGKAEDYSDITKLIAAYEGEDKQPGSRSGLNAFKEVKEVNIISIPGITDVRLLQKLVEFCENEKDKFAVIDMPKDSKAVDKLKEFKENFDSSYAALYHPWIQLYDALCGKNNFFPPSGAVMGIYARTDNTRGVHKSPANEIVRGCKGLSVSYDEMEQGKLNPYGINLIRAIPGSGIRVWGARTCSSDGSWKYVNVRRTLIYIEQSIKANTNWVVFESNDETLWSRVEGTISIFLTNFWRNGVLAGSSPAEAFYVNVGKATMTEDDILNGRLICEIGVALVRPNEFVIFRITQMMQMEQ